MCRYLGVAIGCNVCQYIVRGAARTRAAYEYLFMNHRWNRRKIANKII